MDKPQHWFRATSEGTRLESEPREIEFLRVWTGETFTHTGGTAYWSGHRLGLDTNAMTLAGITHWRLLN